MTRRARILSLVMEKLSGRDAPLYHGTSTFLILDILNSNSLEGVKNLNQKFPFNQRGVSLTRDRRFAEGWGSVVLVLDQNKLHHNYKIIPRDYFGGYGQTIQEERRTESEEFVVGDIGDLDQYLKGIYLDPSLLTSNWVFHNYREVLRLIDHPKFDPTQRKQIEYLLGRENLRVPVYSSAKTAAGLVQLNGLDEYLAKVLAEATWEVLGPVKNELDGDDYAITMWTIFDILKIAGTRMGGVDLTSGVKLSELSSKFHPVIRDEQGQQIFSEVVFKVSMSTKNPNKLGEFQVSTSAYYKQKPDAYWATVYIHMRNIIENVRRRYSGWMLGEDIFYRMYRNTVAHELLHAVDWVYQARIGDKDWHDREVSNEPGSLEYFNSDTELKSWAKSLALSMWEKIDPKSLADYLDILRMSSDLFWRYLKLSDRGFVIDKILPQNKQKFIQRVVSELKRMAQKEYDREKFRLDLESE